MTLAPAPLQSRFGRRLLLLFVGCAVLPVVVVAAVSYGHITRELRSQSERRLQQANAAMGLALYERLLLLDATLKSLPPRVVFERDRERGEPDERRLLTMGLDLLASRRFLALEFVGDDGRRVPVFGQIEERPVLTPNDYDDLQANLPLVRALPHGSSTARTFLLRRLEHGTEIRGTLIGEVSPDFLWGSLAASLPSPNTMIAVTDEASRVLFRSTQADLVAQADPIVEAAPVVPARSPQVPDSAGRAYVAASSPLLLDEVFSAPTWTLTLSETEDEVLGPLARFTHLFAWAVALSGLTVLLLSGSQIQRSLVPLVELREGTRRIAQRDFASRVTVTSKDEFEELATSFNAMAVQLGRQFQALSTAADLDRAVLSATDVASIVDTLLARTRDVLPCHIVGVTLVAHDGGKSLAGVLYDYCDEVRHTTRVELRSEDVQDLLAGPDLMRVEPTSDPMPAYLVPMVRLGPCSMLVLPLRFQRQLVGILILGERSGVLPGADEQVQIRRLADQVAVALANVRMLEQVKSLAYFDSLTGLPNRLSYKERLAQALAQARRGGKLVAAFFIDLDHFSRINDTLGHEAGDQLLQQVALRLRASCRDREDEIAPAQDASADVARLGGDEFTVLMPGLTRPDDAAKLARRILSSLAHPVPLAGQEIFVTASIGIALYPDDGEDLETLLMHADTAMYKAKEQGGNSYQTYSRTMNARALQRFTLENALRRALERAEFELHYQPIVDGRSGATAGAEALVRWRHPELGLLLPSEFVPLAEENGLIVPLGEWVLEEACRQNLAWQEAGLPPIRVVVNLSSRQLRRTLPDVVARTLQTTGLESRFLGLELTESLLVKHHREDTDTLQALRAMGLHLAVDDFGTGYSSFSYLKHLPLDALKIDRSFIREVTISPDDAAITTAIIAMAHALELRVVAEGIETEAQRAVLRAQGCDDMQGYLFSRPVPAEALAAFLAKAPVQPRGARRLKRA